jgi:hypothetical protein
MEITFNSTNQYMDGNVLFSSTPKSFTRCQPYKNLTFLTESVINEAHGIEITVPPENLLKTSANLNHARFKYVGC